MKSKKNKKEVKIPERFRIPNVNDSFMRENGFKESFRVKTDGYVDEIWYRR